MNWDDLQPFLALIRQGSLSGAARALRVEHATVARRIDRLETALGVRLFDRLPRGWQPTAEARALLERAEAAEAAVLDLRRQAHGGAAGPVRLSAPPLLAAEVLTPRLAEFLGDNAGIRLEIVAESDQTDLIRGDADLALRVGPVVGASLRVRRLGTLRYRPYTITETQAVIRPKEARSEPERWMQAWSGDRPVVLHTRDSSVMRAAALAGYGTALLPEFYAHGLSPVGTACLERPLHLTLHEDKAKAPRVRLVADDIASVLVDWFRENDLVPDQR